MTEKSVILEGGKAVAALLEQVWGHPVSVRRVYGYAQHAHDPVPVYWVRNRLYANAKKVTTWANRQYVYRRYNRGA